tara:strand:+ start:15864 stop:16820 length:957 start_codon:yes stop_codon:yes gene_type:complete
MKRIKIALKKRKIKIFLIFLFVSSLAWLISELSGNYSGSAVFEIVYTNSPDSLLFVGASQNKIDVKLRASGFSFLRFNFGNKKIRIDVSKAQLKSGNYIVPKSVYQFQIEQQLPQSMELVSIYNDDTILLELYPLFTKKIPVISKLDVSLNQNYMLDTPLKISPDSILVKGPRKELDKIKSINTTAKEIADIADDFSEKLTLVIPAKTANVRYFTKEVVVYGKVARFSEKIIEVPITVVNLPQDYEINIIPNSVSVLCKAKIDDLKQLKASDFTLIADYEARADKEQQTLILALKAYPQVLNEPKLLTKEVRFILKRK